MQYLHLQVCDELLQRDLLLDLLKQAAAAQDHALQDGQGELLDRGVHGLEAHIASDLRTRERVRKDNATGPVSSTLEAWLPI